MKLFTASQYRRLLKNGDPLLSGKDHFPVVKLFTPFANAVWLLTEIDPHEPDMAFGLCDLGVGFPELGYVSLGELTELTSNLWLSVERDTSFKATHPLSVYARAAGRVGCITEDERALQQVRTVKLWS